MSNEDMGGHGNGDWATLLGPDEHLPLATEDTYLDAYRQKVALGEYLHLLTFDLAGQRYALALTDVTEIRRYVTPTPIPGTKDFVLGIIALRGSVVPVLDLRIRLGLPAPEPTEDSRYLLLAGEERLGVLVDRVVDVTPIPDKELETVPATIGPSQAEFIQGIGRSGDQIIILLKAEPILNFDPLTHRDKAQ